MMEKWCVHPDFPDYEISDLGRAKRITSAADTANIHTAIHTHIEAGSTLHTDEAKAYSGLVGLFFKHGTVNHSGGE
jgi:hypothetical protein